MNLRRELKNPDSWGKNIAKKGYQAGLVHVNQRTKRVIDGKKVI